MKTRDQDKPWISNYPPLQDWLNEYNAECQWQLPVGKKEDPAAYVECWKIRDGLVIVVVYAQNLGWEMYSAPMTNRVDETLADALSRCTKR